MPRQTRKDEGVDTIVRAINKAHFHGDDRKARELERAAVAQSDNGPKPADPPQPHNPIKKKKAKR
jgi:hypothetical protein